MCSVIIALMYCGLLTEVLNVDLLLVLISLQFLISWPVLYK